MGCPKPPLEYRWRMENRLGGGPRRGHRLSAQAVKNVTARGLHADCRGAISAGRAEWHKIVGLPLSPERSAARHGPRTAAADLARRGVRRGAGLAQATPQRWRSDRGAARRKKPRSGAPWPRRSASANAPSATCGAPRRLEECQARRAMAEPACGLRLSDFRRARRAGGRCRTGHESARPGLAEKTGDREPGPPARRIRARLGDGVEIPATGKSITLARSSRKPAAVAAGNTPGRTPCRTALR